MFAGNVITDGIQWRKKKVRICLIEQRDIISQTATFEYEFEFEFTINIEQIMLMTR